MISPMIRDAAEYDELPHREPMRCAHRVPRMRSSDVRFHHDQKESR